MMGSTSAALNALTTSFTKDWYQPYINPKATDRQSVRAARISTAVFGALMIIVGTVAAYFVIHNPKLTIIPLALSILGYSYGSILGVFLLAVLTKTRGLDVINFVATILGMFAVLIFGKVKFPFFGHEINFGFFMPEWFPAISWVWHILIGCSVTFLISICFRTPQEVIDKLKEKSSTDRLITNQNGLCNCIIFCVCQTDQSFFYPEQFAEFQGFFRVNNIRLSRSFS